jgi:hypothetical protein
MKQSILVILLTFSIIFANAQGWMWATQFTGAGQNQPVSILYDATGCSYVYGNFNLTVNQDAYTLTSSGPQDIYFAKYNKQGQVLWIKQVGGSASETAVSMSLSKDGNYIYLLGFTNSNPCLFESNNIATTGLNDIFIVKYSLDGTCQWVKNVAYGVDHQYMGNFELDANNNIILTGHFLTSVTFYGNSTTLTSLYNGIRQGFISKFDQNGNLIWAKMLQCDNSSNTIRTVSVDNTGYYLSGISAGNFLFDIGTITSTAYDGFIYKTDLNGNGLWVRKISGTGNEVLWRHKGDVNGNQYLTGYFNSPSLTVDSTSSIASKVNYVNVNSGTNDLLLIKYNQSGTLQWVKTMGTASDDVSYNLDIKGNTSIITGSFNGTITFDNLTLSTNGISDAYLTECNSSGQFISAKKIGGKSNDIGKAILYSSTGRNFVTAGEFYSDTLTIGTSQFINASTLRDSYLAKYGCFDSLSFQSTLVSCVDGGGVPLVTDGTATVIPSFGSEPYTYIWSNGATTSSISGLAMGAFSVTVSGANGCTLSGSVSVGNKPFLQATITNIININCNGSATGSATVTASKGNPTYSYHWSTGETGVTIQNKLAGNYSVTVTDQCGNEVIANAVITQPLVLSANISVQTNVSCKGGTDGSAKVLASGGTAPYTYLWNNPAPAQVTAICSGLTAGTWSVTVTDEKLCTAVTTVTITQPATILTSAITAQTNVLCYGASTGSAKVTAYGGTSPYTYLWNDPAPAQVNSTCTTLSAGTWSATVTDNKGCTSTSNVTITQPIALTVSITNQTNVLCFGQSTGSFTISGSGGVSPYLYSIDGGLYQTSGVFNGISAGIHTLTVKDANACTTSLSGTITQPAQLQAVVASTKTKTCSKTGTATATPSNGTSPYTYKWKKSGNNPIIGTTPTISNLGTGTYSVTVTDNCSASVVRSIVVTAYSALTSATANTFCSTSSTQPCNGYATATAVGGNPPLTYKWNTSPIQYTQETTHTLCAYQSYRVTITDGCNDRKTSSKRKIQLCAKSVSSDEPVFTENANNISLYPNPVATQLSILVDNDESTGENAVIEIEIYNLLGVLVSKEKKEIFYGSPVLKDVSNYQTGLYMVTIIDGEEITTQRILIQK